MTEPLFTEGQVSEILNSLHDEYAPHVSRLRVRRALIDLVRQHMDETEVGVHIPQPFDRSQMILKTTIAEPVKEIQRYVSRISANPPKVSVIPPTIGKEKLTHSMENHAAEQERLLNSMWYDAGGPRVHREIAWSQSWGRIGWILTLPRDTAWGLPDREYYDDLTDDEIERMQEEGKLSPVALDGRRRMESASSWMERRRQSAEKAAVAGKSLNTLEAFPPDMVFARRDGDGIKYLSVVEQVPASDFIPGSALARMAAARSGFSDDDLDKYGLYLDEKGRVAGGVNKGGEPNSQRQQWWTLSRLITRHEVYYYVSGSPGFSGGKIIYHDVHGDGVVPCVEVPFYRTDSRAPGAEFSSPLEAVFTYAPILNQLETLLSNVAAYNAIPRWVIETEDGAIVRNEETGDPMIVGSDTTVGLDPRDAQPVAGRVRQLKIDDADLLLNLLMFYSERLDKSRVPDVATGAAATTGPAWNVRQQITQAQLDLQPAIDHMAEAVQQVMRIWIARARKLDTPIYAFSLPGHRRDPASRRSLIEFDPRNLTESVRVVIDPNTASDRVVLMQAGIELLAAGRIDNRKYFEEYALEDDPDEAELRSYVQKVKDLILLGDTTTIMQGSLLFNVAEAVRGRLAMELMRRSPGAALAQAESMAQQAQLQQTAMLAPPNTSNVPGGNLTEVQGIRQPGIGMSIGIPGSPEMGAATIGGGNANPGGNNGAVA